MEEQPELRKTLAGAAEAEAPCFLHQSSRLGGLLGADIPALAQVLADGEGDLPLPWLEVVGLFRPPGDGEPVVGGDCGDCRYLSGSASDSVAAAAWRPRAAAAAGSISSKLRASGGCQSMSRTLLQHSGRLAHSVTLATRTGWVMTSCTGPHKSSMAHREGGADALLAPDAVKVDALPGLVREPGDGVGDDVGAVAAELVCAETIFSVARNRIALAISRLAVGGIDGGALSPSLIMNSRKFFSAPRLTMCGSWSQECSNLAASALVNFCRSGCKVLNARCRAGVRSRASASAYWPRARS